MDRLRYTADRVEAAGGASVRSRTTDAPEVRRPDPIVDAPAAPPARRSMGRLLVATAVHTAITVAVLTGVTALVDPVLPHAERPALSGPVEASATAPGDLLASPNTP